MYIMKYNEIYVYTINVKIIRNSMKHIFVRSFKPTVSELQSLKAFLETESPTLETLRRLNTSSCTTGKTVLIETHTKMYRCKWYTQIMHFQNHAWKTFFKQYFGDTAKTFNTH